MTLDDLKKITRKTIQSAGPRYTPGVKEDAPNLHIQGLERALSGLTVNSDFKRLLTETSKSLSEALGKGGGSSPALKALAAKVNSAASLIEHLAKQPPHRGRAIATRLTETTDELVESLQVESHRMSKLIWAKREELAPIKERRDPSDSSAIAGIG